MSRPKKIYVNCDERNALMRRAAYARLTIEVSPHAGIQACVRACPSWTLKLVPLSDGGTTGFLLVCAECGRLRWRIYVSSLQRLNGILVMPNVTGENNSGHYMGRSLRSAVAKVLTRFWRPTASAQVTRVDL